MSLLGGILKSVINPMTIAQLAMGPAGWASIAMKAIGSAIAQQVIQQLGQKLGLPQPMIDMAQAAFAQASGQPGLARQNMQEAVAGLAQQFNLSPTQQGQLERAGNDQIRNLLQQFIGSDEFRAAQSGGGGKGFLERIAVALGKSLDNKMNKAAALADQIGQQGDSKQSKLGELNGKLAAVSQEISILSNALNTVIKSIGEAQATIARKS